MAGFVGIAIPGPAGAEQSRLRCPQKHFGPVGVPYGACARWAGTPTASGVRSRAPFPLQDGTYERQYTHLFWYDRDVHPVAPCWLQALYGARPLPCLLTAPTALTARPTRRYDT